MVIATVTRSCRCLCAFSCAASTKLLTSSKLDKECIIFNHKKEEGFKILTVDSNRYDARYWLEHFLSVDAFEDENFITKNI
jgi:hypothetical protein